MTANRYNGLKTLSTGSQDLMNKLDDDVKNNTFSGLFDFNSTQDVAISAADGSINANTSYATSDFIRVDEFGWHSFENIEPNLFGINIYDQDRNLIKFGARVTYRNKQIGGSYVAIRIPEDGYYAKVTYLKTNAAIIHSYKGVFIEKDQFPFKNDLVIPENIYQIKNKYHYYYHKQMVDASRYNDLDVLISIGDRYYDQTVIRKTSAGTAETYISWNVDGVSSSTYKNIVTVDPIVNAGKTISKLHIGNSFTDYSIYQQTLNSLLSADSVTVTELGTMGETGGLCEALSGGSIANYLDIPGNEAVILTVSGVTTQPSTSFPGDIYEDANGTRYYCRGNQLSGGNGKIKFVSQTATIPTPTPASGTMTRITGSGDATISYSSYVDAYTNPFWNPVSNQRDWNYYLTTWGYTAPQIVELQFSVNDFAGAGYDGDAVIDDIFVRTKAVIDEIIAAWSGVKIIYTIQPAGALPEYVLGSREGVMKSTIQLARKFINEFELKTSATAYNNVVFLCPSYINVNPKLAYNITSVVTNARYSESIDRAQDSVHPRTEGFEELADHMHPLVQHVITLLP